MKSSGDIQISLFLLIQLIWQFQNPSFLLWSSLPLLIPLFPPPPVSLGLHACLPLSWEHMGQGADPGSRWVWGTDAASSLPSPLLLLLPPVPPLGPPATTSPSLLSTCLGHRPGGWVAVRVPHQRLGHCFVIPPKTKGYLGRPAACPRGTQCHEAGRPVDSGPSITCPLYVNERQGASVVCVCVRVSNLRSYARRRGRRQRIWRVCAFLCVWERSEGGH